MNPNLSNQILLLKTALGYAKAIQECETYIHDNIHVDYYRSVKSEALKGYAEAMAVILENSIDIAVEYEKPKGKSFDERLFEQLNIITKDYKSAF